MFNSKENDDIVLFKGVDSLARPAPNYLLALRAEVQRNPGLQALFKEFREATEENAAESLAEQVTGLLESVIDGPRAEIYQAARFLSDEYFQHGTKTLLISKQTGKPLMEIREEDLWQPPPAAREGSSKLVERPKEIKPELMGFITRWTFEREREQQIVSKLEKRVKGSIIPKDQDIRLLVSTMDGRKKVADRLKDQLSGTLGNVRGRAGLFLNSFPVSEEEGVGTVYRGLTAIARVELFLADHLSRNLKYDVLHSKDAEIGLQWAKEIAREVGRLVHVQGHTPIDIRSFTSEGMLVTDDQSLDALPTQRNFFVVERVESFVLSGHPCGGIIPRHFDLAHRFIHDRWEIAAKLEYDLLLDPNAVESIVFTNVPSRVHMGQVVA